MNTLLEIVNGAVLFHAPDQTAYADIEVSGHRETWKVQIIWVPRLVDAAPTTAEQESPLTPTRLNRPFETPRHEPSMTASSARSTFALAATTAASISIWPIPIGVP